MKNLQTKQNPKFNVDDKVRVISHESKYFGFKEGTVGVVKLVGDHIGGFDYDIEVENFFSDGDSLCQWHEESELELQTE